MTKGKSKSLETRAALRRVPLDVPRQGMRVAHLGWGAGYPGRREELGAAVREAYEFGDEIDASLYEDEVTG